MIEHNPLLGDLSAFLTLTTIETDLSLSNNDALVDLNDFGNLSSGLEDLFINDNDALTDVSGLNGLGDALGADPICTGDLNISRNTSLTDAAATALLDSLEAKYPGSAVAGSVQITGN